MAQIERSDFMAFYEAVRAEWTRTLGEPDRDGYYQRRTLPDGGQAAIDAHLTLRVVVGMDLTKGWRAFYYDSIEDAREALASVQSVNDRLVEAFRRTRTAGAKPLTPLCEWLLAIGRELGEPDVLGYFKRRRLPDGCEAAIVLLFCHCRVVVGDDLTHGYVRGFDYAEPAEALAALLLLDSARDAPAGSIGGFGSAAAVESMIQKHLTKDSEPE